MTCYNFPFYTTLSESRTNHYAILTGKFLCNILLVYFFGIYECQYDFVVIIRSCLRKAFPYAFVSIL